MTPALAPPILICPPCRTCGQPCDVSACHRSAQDSHLCAGGHISIP